MLKPADPGKSPQPERPIGDLVQQLTEEGKAYAKAELAVAKAIASTKARALAIPAAVTVFAVGVFAALYWLFGAVLAGFVAFLIFGGLAGALTWYAVQRLKRDL
jgi:hypothetical protein